jgi:hypothetical protein
MTTDVMQPYRDPETYLGDAVYASFDGYQIKLRTGDGTAQVIYLEPEVLDALVRFAAKAQCGRSTVSEKP